MFKFVGENPDTVLTKDFLKTLMEFIYQTFNLSQEEIIEMATELPSNTQTEMVSTWDRLIAEGKEIGKQETETKKNLEITLSLLKQFPQLSDDLVASVAKVKPAYVKEIRKVFARTRITSIKRYIRRLFKKLPGVNKQKWEELEKWGVGLWKEYKKQLKE